MTRIVSLPRDRQRVVPWRNGLGSTREVAIEPADGSVERGFDWRISCAGVAADGPSSHFAGIDRSLWLVRGAGIELTVDGRHERLDRRWQRCDFAGEANVTARLLDGPIDDVNVMVRRGVVRAQAELHCLAEGSELPLSWGQGSHVLLCLGGTVTVVGGVLGSGDALRCDGAVRSSLLALDGEAGVLVTSFVRVAVG